MLWYLLSQCDTNSFGWVRLVFFLCIHSVAFIIAIVVVGAVVVVVVRGSCYCCENVLKETNRFLLLFKIIKASPWWRWIESSLNKSAFHPYKVKVFNSLSIFPLSLQVLFFTRLRLNNHHIGNLNVCSFSLVKKIKFRRCFNLFNRKDNVDDFFPFIFSYIVNVVWSLNSKTSLPKFYLELKSSTVKSYPITFFSFLFFAS